MKRGLYPSSQSPPNHSSQSPSWSSSRRPKEKLSYLDKARIWSNMNRLSCFSLALACTLFTSSFLMIFAPVGSSHSPPTPSLMKRSLTRFATSGKHVSVKRNSSRIPALRVSQLRPSDYQMFTVRINTWKRQEQLRVSIQHHLTCPSVAQIQVVWCVDQGPVPTWLMQLSDRVVVEQHEENSLNERFRILQEPPTAAILSIDDDVLRPCLALASAFEKWKANPDRQIGFDARSHQVEDNNRWKYGYLSTTERTNKYSISLTRCCFLHRDYLHSYSTAMPATIRQTVKEHLNCEDIAMSLWISSQTDGQPPLLADYWVVKSQIKMYVPSKISGGQDHKGIRDRCMDEFGTALHLKDRLRVTKLRHDSLFEYGAQADNWNVGAIVNDDLNQLERRWKVMGMDDMMKEVMDMISEAQAEAYDRGLIENTHPWKKRFKDVASASS